MCVRACARAPVLLFWLSFTGSPWCVCLFGKCGATVTLPRALPPPPPAVNPTGSSFHLRAHEQELTKRHERELNDLTAAHSRDTQNMLSDFNKAQEVLKDKISALQIL